MIFKSKLATATLLLVVLFFIVQHPVVNGFGSFYKYNISKFAYSGETSQGSLYGDVFGVAITNPKGLCRIGGNIFYVDAFGIHKINMGTGQVVENFYRNPLIGGVSCSSTYMYISIIDGLNMALLKFDPSLPEPSTIVGGCDYNMNEEDIPYDKLVEGPLGSACFSNPSVISWSETLSTLFVIDSNKVVSVTSTQVKTYAGNGICSSNAVDVIGKKPLLAPLCPTHVTAVKDQVFFVSSGSVFTIQNNAVVLFACSDADCQSSINNIFPSENGDALLLHTSDNTIRNVSLKTGNHTNVVQKFSNDVNVHGFSSYGDNAYLFVTNDQVKLINLTNSQVTAIAGIDYSGPNGFNARYALGNPKGVALKGNYLYVAESYYSKIVKVDLTTNILTTLVVLDCYPYFLQINYDTGNLGFLCKFSKKLTYAWDVREYDFNTKNVTIVSKFAQKDPFALTYCSSTKTYYTLSYDGFCTTTSDTLSSGCELLPDRSYGGLSCYNDKFYYAYSKNLIKSWPVGASVSTRSGSDALPSSAGPVGNYIGLHITPDGTFYPLSATTVQRREELAPASVIIAGSSLVGNIGDGGLALSASIGNPVQIAVSPTHDRIYIMDTLNNYVRVLSPSGLCVSNIFIGSSCDILCGGIASSNYSSVCSGGLGTCSTTFDGYNYQAAKCKCHDGTSGDQCEIFNCFGKSNKLPTACSGQGTCVDVNLCKCFEGYEGIECASMTCGGISASSPNVCNGTKCIGPNICEPICYGKPQSSQNACYGEGICISTNNCSCLPGRYGNECQFSDPCSSCENGGTCYFNQGKEACNCTYGYVGLNCSSYTCNGILSTDRNVCSGEGTCTDVDTCHCAHGRYGRICEGSETCKSLSCGAEQCFFQNGTETCLHRCGLYAMNESIVCSSRGLCVGAEKCECPNNWTGSKCEMPVCNGIAKNQSNACSGNGVCSNTGLNTYCSCSYGHTGINCEFFTCKNISEADNTTCLGKGSCIGRDKCKCNDAGKWTGDNCEIPICFGVPANDPAISSVCNDMPCIAPDTCDKLTEFRPIFPYRYSQYIASSLDYLGTLGFGTKKKFYAMEYNKGMLYISSTFSVFRVDTSTNTTTAILNIQDFGITGIDDMNYFIKTAISKNGRYMYAVCRMSGESKVITFDLYYSKVLGVSNLSFAPKEVKLNSKDDKLFMDDPSNIIAYSVSPIFDLTTNSIITTRWGGSEFLCFDISGDYLYLIRSNIGSNLNKYNLKTGASTTINSGLLKSIRVSEDHFILGVNGYMVNSWDQGSIWTSWPDQKNFQDVVYLGDATALAYGSGYGFFFLQPNYTAGCYSNNFNPNSQCVPSCDGTLATSYSSVCYGNGYCTDNNKCTCKSGFDSTFNCAACTKVCNNTGICTFNGTATKQYCKCPSIFTGESCETPKCSSKSDCLNSLIYTPGNIDCVGSKCVPLTCSSDAECKNHTTTGYSKCIGGVCGFECSENSDCSVMYQDKKFCREFNSSGYSYKKCDTECSTALQCNNNITRPLCLNQSCSEVTCKNETDCYSNGLSVCSNGLCSYECLTNSDCPKTENYITTCGSDSTIKSEYRKCVKKPVTCFGLSYSDPKVCSGQGTCKATNECLCKDGHVGSSCAYSVCFGIPANNSFVCSGRGNCSNVDTCSCSTLYEGNQCEKLKNCSGKLDCLNGGSCVYTLNGEVCNCVNPYFGKSCEKKSCTSQLDCSETSTCDLVKGYCVGINCTSNETCQAIGMHKCGVDGVCVYECETNSDCPYLTPYCNNDKNDKTKFKRCTKECILDGDCAKFGKTSCGINSNDPLTYQRCYNKECTDNDGCVSVSGRPRCDTSVFRCISVGCFAATDCAPYGYPHCNSNGTCVVECMVHDDCKVTGSRRCGMNPSNTNEYHKCVASCEAGANNCEVCASDRLTCSICVAGYAWDGNKCIPRCNNNSDCTDEIKPICGLNGLCKGVNCSTNADCVAKGFSLCSVNGTCGFECISNSDCKDEYLPICGSNKNISSSYRKCIGECSRESDCNGYYGRPLCITSGSKPGGGRCSKYPCYSDSQCNFATNSKCICSGDCYCRPECVQDSDCNKDQRRVCESGLCAVKKCSNDTDCPYKGYSMCDPYYKYCKAECSSNSDCQLSSNNPLLNTCSKKDDITLNRCVEGCKKDADCLEGILSFCDVAHATCNYRYCTDNANCTVQGYTSCGPQNNAGQTYCDRECSYDSYCATKYPAKPVCSKKIDATLNTCVPECVQDVDCAAVVSKKKCSVETGRCVPKPCSIDGDCSEVGYSFCGSSGVCTFECLGDSQCASKFGKTKCNLNSAQATYQRCIPECLQDNDCSSVSGRPKCNTTSKACEPKSCTTRSDCGENGFTSCTDSKCVPECLNDRNCIGVVKSGYKTESCDVSKYSGSKGTCQSITAVSRVCTSNSNCDSAGYPSCKEGYCNRQCMYDSDCPSNIPYCDMSYGGGRCTNQPCLVNSDCTLKGFKQCYSKTCVQTECSGDYQCTKGVCITDYSSDLVNTCQTQCNATIPCKSGKVCNMDKERCVDVSCTTNSDCSSYAPYTTCRNSVCKVECELDNHCSDPTKFCDLYRNKCVAEIICNLGCANGTCYNNTKTGEAKCICNPGYIGSLCNVLNETATQTCSLNCLNGGVCEKDKCVCKPGFNGYLCQHIVQPCTLECQNGGSCVNNTDGVSKCQCLPTFTGNLCQDKSTNPCTLQCGIHGTCVNATSIASCSCKDNFSGERCSVCTSGFDILDSLCICNLTSRVIENGACVCNQAAGFVSSETNECIRKTPICAAECGAHGSCVYKDEKTTNTVCKCESQWVSTASAQCSDCDSTVGLILSNGICVCNTELGFTKNAQGKCVRNESPKCDISCGSNGVCEFESSTSTVSVCKCKNGFATTDPLKPCSVCPAKTIQSGSNCICDVSIGYTSDQAGSCVCNALKGYKSDSNGKCMCNPEYGFTENGKSCVCANGYENQQGRCKESVPTCSTSCGNGVCQFDNIAISTSASCKCNKGFASKMGEIPCSSCAPDYISSNNVCKRVCPVGFSGENCDNYSPSSDCITLPSTALSFCKSSIDYTVLNTLYINGAVNDSNARFLLLRNAAKNDALARERFDSFINSYTQEGQVCNEKCAATLTKFACYSVFQSCSKRASVPVCKSVCEQVINTELTGVPAAFNGICNSFNSSNCFYGSYLPSDTSCFGTIYTDSSVCSSRGKCTNQDSCVCSKGYTGAKCELSICFDKDSSNSQVCSGRGKCTGVNTCECNVGFTGPECQLSTCNGKLESEGGCSFRGSCSDSHTCSCSGRFDGAKCDTCKPGMTGTNCDVPVCNGVKATDSSVCSGKGKCVIEGNNPVCKCNAGYDGTSCQSFKCDGIDRNSANVCGGKGKCISYNTCVCSNSAFDASKFCAECSPSFQGIECSERRCSDELTCSGHGKCDASYKCGCNGNWVGEFCNTCKSGFVGSDCQFECSAATNCNSRGSCNLDGSCSCQTHAFGAKCETCETGWYGEKCDFSIDATSFGFTTLGDSIYGTVYSTLKKKFLCSELIVNHDILGTGAKCLLNGEKSTMEITLGPSASIVELSTLQFKNFFGSSQTTDVIVAKKDYVSLAPTASLKSEKASISKACGSIYLDASGSVSLDRRSLIFSWSVTNAPTTDDSMALESIISAQGSSSGIKISGQTLGIGSYSVQVTVTSTFSKDLKSSSTVTFQVSDLTSPSVSIKEGLESSIVIGKTSVISPIVSFPSCYGGVGPVSYVYSLDATKSVDSTLTIRQNKEMLVFSNELTKISVEGDYYFVLTVSQQGASTVNVPFKVTARALPLLVSFNVRDMTQSKETPVIFNIEKQDPSNPTDTSGSISLSCSNLLTGDACFSPIIDDKVPFTFNRSMEPGTYSFTAVFSKGSISGRISSTSVKITLLDQPKSKIIRVSIVPPTGCDTSVVDPSSDLILQASNQDVLSSSRIYSWSSTDMDLSTIPTNLKYIQIPKTLLVPGATYKILLKLVDGDRSGDADITFTVNSPPTIGVLEINPTTGVALKDEFQVMVGNGWYDPQVPLSYEFLYKLSSESTWSILSSKSEKKSIATSLPAGTLDIKVIVYDANGASSETTTQIVTTVPSPQEALSALTVSQQGSVTVSSISSALSVVGSVSAATPEEKEALKAAGTAFVDKYFKQSDEQGSVVAETSDSVASKVSVISSIGGCVNNLADSTVSFSVSKFSETTSSASSSESIKMNEQDIKNSENSASAFSSHISGTLRRAFTLDDMSRIEQIFSDLVNVQIKNLVADMPAIKTKTGNMNVYARLVSISTLEGLSENVDSTTSFNLTKAITSMPEFNQVESVKLYCKTQSTTMKSAVSKIVEFSIFNNNQQMVLNNSQTIATISVGKLTSARNSQAVTLKCFELQNGTYIQSTQCTILSESDKTFTLETRTTGSFLVQLVSQTDTNPTNPTNPQDSAVVPGVIVPKPNMDYVALILLIIPVVALVAVVVASVYLILKKRRGKKNDQKKLNEKELMTI